MVTLSRDGVDVANDLTTPNGAANFSLPGLAPGTYTFVAKFAGTQTGRSLRRGSQMLAVDGD